MSYFNLDYNEKLCTKLRHSLNRAYAGSQAFEMTAPDAAGTLIVHARSEEEAEEHLRNALFDFIFHRNRVRAFVTNPACIFCGERTVSRGRNSSGNRTWRCLGNECGRSFTMNREWRGGINHPSQSKKPAFYQMVFVEGKTIREAIVALKISHGAADNWYRKMAAMKSVDEQPKCRCGKPIRHRGSCAYRMSFKGNVTAMPIEEIKRIGGAA